MDSCFDQDSLKPVSLLPVPFQSIFSFRYFNAVQSESFAEVFLSDENLVIAAPTGSGKTVLFELCILRLLGKSLTPVGHFNHVSGARKTVYIAPMKALVQEKLRDWTRRFSCLGLKCKELTSDSGPSNVQEMLDTDVILTTPEKFDIITRRHRDRGGMSFFGDISLLLIDEVHLLSETRGAALEAVVSRLKMLARYPEMKGCPLANVRFVAVSATVPNIDDLAEWLNVSATGRKRFGEEYRPVRLTTRVFGYAPAKNDFLFEKRLQHYLYDILMQHSEGRPSLVFCSTRKGAQETAVTLAEGVSKLGNQNPFIKSLEQYDRLQLDSQKANDGHMQQCIRCGVGFHNGGLTMHDRNLVEGLFLSGDLSVLCTTSTLAHGVNLPAHAVIIKSTQYYDKVKGGYVEYERSSILQMSGRAGRPQFDDSGVVIIMTRKESVHLYQNLLSGSEPVESQLLPSIVEHLNAEIVLMTISDCSQAIDWLKCSYLYVRIKKNPQHYSIKHGTSREQLENKLKEICVQNVNELARYGMVQADEFGFVLNPLEPGRIMEKYYLQFETMKAITEAPDRSTMEDLLHVVANAKELSWIKLRRDEKKKLNDVNGDISGRVRFHVKSSNGKLKKRIQTNAEKIFVLVNDVLSGEPSTTESFTLSQDINGICTNGTRICRCMSDYFIFMKRFREIRSALLLSKCLSQRLWENTSYQLKQLVGVGMVTTKALLTAGVDSFDKLATADPRRLEAITGRKYPYGDQLKASLDGLPPKIELNISEIRGRKDQCSITLSRVSESKPGTSFHIAELVVGTKADNKLLFHEKIRLDQFSSPYTIIIQHPASEDQHGVVIAAVTPEGYVGVDVICKLVMGHEQRCEESTIVTEEQSPHSSLSHYYRSSHIRDSSCSSLPKHRAFAGSDDHASSAHSSYRDAIPQCVTSRVEAPPRYPPRKFMSSPSTPTVTSLDRTISTSKQSPFKTFTLASVKVRAPAATGYRVGASPESLLSSPRPPSTSEPTEKSSLDSISRRLPVKHASTLTPRSLFQGFKIRSFEKSHCFEKADTVLGSTSTTTANSSSPSLTKNAPPIENNLIASSNSNSTPKTESVPHVYSDSVMLDTVSAAPSAIVRSTPIISSSTSFSSTILKRKTLPPASSRVQSSHYLTDLVQESRSNFVNCMTQPCGMSLPRSVLDTRSQEKSVNCEEMPAPAAKKLCFTALDIPETDIIQKKELRKSAVQSSINILRSDARGSAMAASPIRSFKDMALKSTTIKNLLDESRFETRKAGESVSMPSTRPSSYRALKSFSPSFTASTITRKRNDTTSEVSDKPALSRFSPDTNVKSIFCEIAPINERTPGAKKSVLPSRDNQTLTQPSPTGQQEYMGYKSLFSFL